MFQNSHITRLRHGFGVCLPANAGGATLGTLIGAGGCGQPILTGIRLDDVSLILEDAIPAAVPAIAVQYLFELAERAVVPRNLRMATRT